MEIDVFKKVRVNAKTIKLQVCSRDTNDIAIIDQDGETICHKGDCYVPGFFPGNHSGDYLMLNIDIDTGTITNWEEVDMNELQNWIKKGE